MTIILCLFCRVISVIVVTARNVTFALNATPESSAAYESSEKIWSMIKGSKEAAKLQNEGTIKKVFLQTLQPLVCIIICL